MTIKDDALYRPCVGLALMNARGALFAGQRLDSSVEAWQMPQGGIDAGETPEQAAWRELVEEVGTDKAEIITCLPQWYYYELPPALQGKLWGGRYIGQRQRWFLLRFTGTDADIQIDTKHAEFRAWQWVQPQGLATLIVPFKQALYQQVLADMQPYFSDVG